VVSELVNYVLEVGGERFAAAAPVRGDLTRSLRDGQGDVPRVTVGLSAPDASALEGLTGQEARLLTNASLDPTGVSHEIGRLTILKVDRRSALLVGAPERRLSIALRH
jgi:hypothetical protein